MFRRSAFEDAAVVVFSDDGGELAMGRGGAGGRGVLMAILKGLTIFSAWCLYGLQPYVIMRVDYLTTFCLVA